MRTSWLKEAAVLLCLWAFSSELRKASSQSEQDEAQGASSDLCLLSMGAQHWRGRPRPVAIPRLPLRKAGKFVVWPAALQRSLNGPGDAKGQMVQWPRVDLQRFPSLLPVQPGLKAGLEMSRPRDFEGHPVRVVQAPLSVSHQPYPFHAS